MKRMFTYILLVALAAPTLQSCSGSKSNKGILGGTGGTVAKTVVTVVGVILLSKLLKSVLGNVLNNQAFTDFSGNQSLVNNFKETTPLTNIANNDILKTAMAFMVSEKYEIPLATVVENYKSFKTAEDLATFIGKNAGPDVLKKIQAMPE